MAGDGLVWKNSHIEKKLYICNVNHTHIRQVTNLPYRWWLTGCLLMLMTPIAAQVNCRSFQNPTSFNYVTGSMGQWSARVGDRILGSNGGSTGDSILSTCSYPTATVISGHDNITSSQYYSGVCRFTNEICGHTFFDAHDHRFSIYNVMDNGGLDEFTINGTNGLMRVPPGHTTSIRLGDMRSTGSAIRPGYSSGNDKGSEALFFTMMVRPQTALIFIEYAVVARRFNHSPREAGEFIIRVVGKNSATNRWNNYPLNDSLWYCVPAPHFSGALPSPWMEGLPGSIAGGTTCSYCYKPWTKVAINLTRYMYDSVRIEMYTSDCVYNVDPIYAYIAGSCQPMNIVQQGCVSGTSDAIDTLRAPEELLSYAWYVSTTGFSGNSVAPSEVANLRFRRVSSSTAEHVAVISDFLITEGPDRGDTAAEQLFKCVVTSALDPEKPFSTELYSSVRNTRPVISSYINNHCNGTVDFYSSGYIPYIGTTGNHIIDTLTRWIIYDGDTNAPVLDTLYGRSVSYTFSDTAVHAYTLTMYSSEEGCYTTRLYQVASRNAPRARLEIPDHELCEGDTAVLVDRSTGIFFHQWLFADTTIEGQGALVDSTRLLRRTFTQAVNPVKLAVGDPFGCIDTVSDTVFYFSPEAVSLSSDTVICEGNSSNIIASSPVRGTTYAWYRSNDRQNGQPFWRGNVLRVVPTDSVARYYVKAVSPKGCVQWDSITLHIAMLSLVADPGHASFCPGDSVLLTAHGALTYQWVADPDDPDLDGREADIAIRVAPRRPTTYMLTGVAADNCIPKPVSCRVVPVPLPLLDIDYSPPFINADEPVVRFYDHSRGRETSWWFFPDSTEACGQEVSHRFDINREDSVDVSLISYNRLNCPSDTTFRIPVTRFSVWCPNVFTPMRGDNNYFSITLFHRAESFHIYIYNRLGMLVYESDDPAFQWDGTCHGIPCPQNAYNYRIVYVPHGDKRKFIVSGLVTLLR